MSMPDKVFILGRPYKFRLVPGSMLQEGHVGECHYDTRELRVFNLLDPFDTVDTTIHEMFHAVLHEQGRENGGRVEEVYVRALATGLAGMMRDNPDAFRYLLDVVQDQ